jgi:oligosaccharyltransferase complex subunit epsilon
MSKTVRKAETQKKVKAVTKEKEHVEDLAGFWEKYSSETPSRIKLIDWLVVYLLSVIGVQFFYRVVVGDDFPKNAFLTGIFCPLGVIILLITIRQEKKDYRKLGEFFLACLVLFLVSINFMG